MSAGASMEQREGYTIAHRDDLERTGNWTLVRRSLACRSFGVNLVDIPSGESIPEHDETQRDQEELFFVISGSPVLVIDGEDHPAGAGTFARVDPAHRRTVRNDGSETSSVLIVSAPTTSGFEPMGWA
ncbi:MAG: cupin domain-containing protein [Solirubrobacterales bacterium]|nr:cupin domain-containing protein [Solirubrobacterales bacterium]